MVAVVLVLRLHGGDARPVASEIALEEAAVFFPGVVALQPGDNLTSVRGEEEALLGFVVKTLPASGAIAGYAGPSDVLLALDTEGVVTGARLLWSGDTQEHADAVRDVPAFFAAFDGWTFAGENDAAAIDAVSGATLTSVAIVESVAVRLGGAKPSLKFPGGIALEDVRRIFPGAMALDDSNGTYRDVLGDRGQLLGRVARTSPLSDAIVGYQGPSDALIGLGAGDLVAGITVGATYESQRYAGYVREDRYFTRKYAGLTLTALAEVDPQQGWSDGVSGATMTSGAVTESVVVWARNAVKDEGAAEPPVEVRSRFVVRPRDGATCLAIVVACLFAFTRLRANRTAKTALQLYLVLVLGLWAGDMVSLAVLGGWADGAVPWRSAPGLVALVAAALILPWGTGKPVYCQHVCPHGAAQEIVYRIVPGRVRLPHWLHRVLSALPYLVLAGGIAIVAGGLTLSLSALEPFDAWIVGIGGLATIVIAVVGLAAAAFVPQAYCKYGCPTGLVLGYLRARRHETRLTRRDAWAVGLLVLAIGLVAL